MSVDRVETGLSYKQGNGTIIFEDGEYEDFSIPLSDVLDFLRDSHLKGSKKIGLARLLLNTAQRPEENEYNIFLDGLEEALDIVSPENAIDLERQEVITEEIGEIYSRTDVRLVINAVAEALACKPFSQLPVTDQMAVERELDRVNIDVLRDDHLKFPF